MNTTEEKKNAPVETNYLVVLENISGRTPGLRTWTNFGTKEQLAREQKEKWMKAYKVVAEGITPDKAVEICGQVPAVIHLLHH